MAATQRERELEELLKRREQEIAELQAEIERLKKLLDGKAQAKSAKAPSFTERYSMDDGEAKLGGKRKRRKKSTGRKPAEAKADRVATVENVYPPDADPKDCQLRRIQRVWRMIDGRAVYVEYRLHAPAGVDTPLPPNVRDPRSEFGREIILSLAYLHYWTGVSIDKARDIFGYFTGLELSRSQADSLLNQLGDDWEAEYEALIELIALQTILYIDETAWKVGTKSRYTWAFITQLYVVFRCGVGRGKEEAMKVIGDAFGGIGVTDNYAAYRNLFTEHQLCWAHLLRKAIKLALQNPDDADYLAFYARLCEIYRLAVRYQKDARLSSGRDQKVEELKAAILELCQFGDQAIEDGLPKAFEDFLLLQHELVDNLNCLFVFVKHPKVEATNNCSERRVRPEAEVRKGGRTSKTDRGARRRSVILSVFASLETRLGALTMTKLAENVGDWLRRGRSLFAEELESARAAPAAAAT